MLKKQKNKQFDYIQIILSKFFNGFDDNFLIQNIQTTENDKRLK